MCRTAPDRAKADLKKQLNMHNVRAGIASQVLSQVETTSASDMDMSASTRSVPTFDPGLQFADSLSSEAARPPPPEEIPMDPVYIHSVRELEDTFRDMLPFFEGKESEENWMLRDKSVTKMRRITKGNAPTDYYQVYMAGIKQLQDGFLKVANSLRTTTSTNGCQLVQELAKTFGPALDPMVEIYLQSFIKMSAATKHIAAQNGNHTVETLCQYVTCNARLMQHVWMAAQDKNIQPRTFAASWLCIVLSRQAGSKMHFEHTGGLDLAEKTIKKGLNDSQPKVKESFRSAYWTFARTWPDKAESIKKTLDEKAKLALERDSHNPNTASAPAATLPNTMRASTTSRAQSRASVRDAILAARKNLAKSQAERPVSAMAAPTTHSPAARTKSSNNLSLRQPSSTRQQPPATSANAPSSTSANASSTEATATSTSSTLRPNSLMSGAARRPVRKVELPRPATAYPYASRRLLHPETPSQRSPANSPRQETVASLARSAAASATRKKLEGESPAASPIRQHATPRSGIPSPKPTLVSPKRSATSPRPSNARRESRDSIAEEPSLTGDEDLTMVLPSRSKQPPSPAANRSRPAIDKTHSVDSGIPAITHTQDDDSLDSHRTDASSTPTRSVTDGATHVPAPASARSSFSHQSRRPSIRNDTVASPSRAQSVPRQSSPLKTSTSALADDFQIHEDPHSLRAAPPRLAASSPQEPRVLVELPINESSQPSLQPQDSPTQEPKSPSQADGEDQNASEPSPPLSPESKAEIVRSRKLLISGIERVKSRTLDAHGFRKVLELVRASESGDIFGPVGEGNRFDDLCAALLEYIVEPLETAGTNAKHSQELSRQAITIIRMLLNKQHSTYRKWVASGRWRPRTQTATFDARKAFEGLGLLVKDLETLCSEVAAKIQLDEGEQAVLEWLEKEQSTVLAANKDVEADIVDLHGDAKVTKQARATALALRTLSSLLARNSSTPIMADVSARVAHMTAASLKSSDAEVRKAAVDLATELHGIWPTTTDVANNTKNDYWALLEKSGVQESARNLIVYFIARRARTT